MLAHSSALILPDSALANEATTILRENSSNLLFNHSIRVYLFAAGRGKQKNLRFDSELLYIASVFHDLGLTKKFSSKTERFEVDGANVAREFLAAHNIREDEIERTWTAIALHTTPGIPKYMRPDIALLNWGVLLDVLGWGIDEFPADLLDEIVRRYPRVNFKQGMIQALADGNVHKPATTYGTVNAAICERFIPEFTQPSACDLIASSPFPDSEPQN